METKSNTILLVRLPSQPTAMRQTTYADEKTLDAFSVLDDAEFEAITVRENISPEAIPVAPQTETLDIYMSLVKWIFLYVPGVAAMHFTLMGMSLFVFYGDQAFDLVVRTLGILIIPMFMVMMGLGRLTDLRHLRVIAGILGAGTLASILYFISIHFFPGEFFGWFTLLTLPVTIIIGQLIKIKTDRESLPHE
jgi:hypothetical protein